MNGGLQLLAAAVCALATVAATGAERDLRFTDVSQASGIELRMTSGAMPSSEILEVNGGGVALVDYDGDGALDIFLANGATLDDPGHGPGSRLYRNLGNGTFQDVTEKAGIGLRGWAMGVAAGDYDGDGDDDLYVTCFGPNVLLRNDDGKFRDVTAAAGVGDPRWGTSAAFGDLDGDGDLDLYVANYLEFDPGKPPPRAVFKGASVMGGPAGLVAQADVLYRNDGDGTFSDVTRAAGIAEPPGGYGLGVAIFDADGDGKLDVLVGNDSTANFFYHNRGGMKFEETGAVTGVAANYDGATQATMGIAVADVDGNARPDVFTTNFSSDTNTLHLNLNGRFFDDRTSQYGLGMVSRRYLGWGTGFQDFDMDGDLDLFVANGHVYPQAATHEIDSDYQQPPLLFRRDENRFEVETSAGPFFRAPLAARATAFGDLDNDGDVDVVVTTLNDAVRVVRNDTPRRGALVVELRDLAGSSRVPGAVVEVESGGKVQRRWLGNGSYQSADSPLAHFGSAANTATIRVVWPDGTVQTHEAVGVGRRVVIPRGESGLTSTPLVDRDGKQAARSGLDND